ncbi:hypothetical protein LAZ67_11001680 [Cordylochernes scorpioides]|uniref:Uncharacterized protein n=1 Tax=Cordylochernes scorpioides TaxID=51811 RepID=A0ABY6KYK9_9ARAC|nr:hypothetical protein LAZ67_11001680 [Cordylochernes scorpioides]
MVVEDGLLWHGDHSWADLVLGEVCARFISVVGDHFFRITVQKLARKRYDRIRLEVGEISSGGGPEDVLEITWGAVMVRNPGSDFSRRHHVTVGAEYDNQNYVWVGQADVAVAKAKEEEDKRPMKLELRGPQTIAMDSAGVFYLDAFLGLRSDPVAVEVAVVRGPEWAVSTGSLGLTALGEHFVPVPPSPYLYNATFHFVGTDTQDVRDRASLEMGLLTNIGPPNQPAEDDKNKIIFTFALYALNRSLEEEIRVTFNVSVALSGGAAVDSLLREVVVMPRDPSPTPTEVLWGKGYVPYRSLHPGQLAVFSLTVAIQEDGFLEPRVALTPPKGALTPCRARLLRVPLSFDLPYVNSSLVSASGPDAEGRFIFIFPRTQLTDQLNDTLLEIEVLATVTNHPANKPGRQLAVMVEVGDGVSPQQLPVDLDSISVIAPPPPGKPPTVAMVNAAQWAELYPEGTVAFNVTLEAPLGAGYPNMLFEANGTHPGVHICQARVSELSANMPCLDPGYVNNNATFLPTLSSPSGMRAARMEFGNTGCVHAPLGAPETGGKLTVRVAVGADRNLAGGDKEIVRAGFFLTSDLVWAGLLHYSSPGGPAPRLPQALRPTATARLVPEGPTPPGEVVRLEITLQTAPNSLGPYNIEVTTEGPALSICVLQVSFAGDHLPCVDPDKLAEYENHEDPGHGVKSAALRFNALGNIGLWKIPDQGPEGPDILVAIATIRVATSAAGDASLKWRVNVGDDPQPQRLELLVGPRLASVTANQKWEKSLAAAGPEDVLEITWGAVMVRNPGSDFSRRHHVTVGAEYDNQNYVWVGQADVAVAKAKEEEDKRPMKLELRGPQTIAMDSAGVFYLDAFLGLRSDPVAVEVAVVRGPEWAVSTGSLGLTALGEHFVPVPPSPYLYNATFHFVGTDTQDVRDRASLEMGLLTNIGPDAEGRFIFIFPRTQLTDQLNDTLLEIEVLATVTNHPANKPGRQLAVMVEVGDGVSPQQLPVDLDSISVIAPPPPGKPPTVAMVNAAQWAELYPEGTVAFNVTLEAPLGAGYPNMLFEANGTHPGVHICQARVSELSANMPCLDPGYVNNNATFLPTLSSPSGMRAARMEFGNTGCVHAPLGAPETGGKLTVRVAVGADRNLAGGDKEIVRAGFFLTSDLVWAGLLHYSSPGGPAPRLPQALRPTATARLVPEGPTPPGEVVRLEITLQTAPNSLGPYNIEVTTEGPALSICVLQVSFAGDHLPCVDPDKLAEYENHEDPGHGVKSAALRFNALGNIGCTSHIHVKCNSTCVRSVVMKSNREFENRAAIIVALRAGRSPKKIVDFLKLPKTTIYRVKKQFDEADSNKEGIATRKKHSRRSDRVKGEEFVKNVKEKIDGNPGKSMRAIAKEMDVGSMTIVRTIHEDLGLKSYALRKGQLLTENMKNNRKGKAAALLNNLKHDSFGMLRFFSDEKNFEVDQKVNPRNDRWICKDPSEIPVVMHTKFPASVMVLGVISSEGDVMPPHFFEKGLRMNADTYINVLETVCEALDGHGGRRKEVSEAPNEDWELSGHFTVGGRRYPLDSLAVPLMEAAGDLNAPTSPEVLLLNDSATLPVRGRGWLHFNVTVPRDAVARLSVTATGAERGGRAVLTVYGLQFVSAGRNIPCPPPPGPVPAELSRTVPTTQLNRAEAHLGYFSNLGLSHGSNEHQAWDDHVTLAVEVGMTDHPVTAAPGSTHALKLDVTLGGVTSTASYPVTVRRDGNERPLLEASAEVIGKRTSFQRGEKVPVAVKLRHTEESRSEPRVVALRLYLPPYLSLDGMTSLVKINLSATPDLVAEEGGVDIKVKTIKIKVCRYADKFREKVVRELQMEKEKGQLFSLTLDEWTSIRSKRYLNINIHSRTKVWNLGLTRISGVFSSEQCKYVIGAKLLEFGIDFETDIVCVTTDGCAMMVKLGHIIGPLQQLCYAHGLHLAMMDVLYAKKKERVVPEFVSATVNEAESDHSEDDNEDTSPFNVTLEQ